MTTLNDLIAEIETITDPHARADKYISSAHIRCNADDGDSSRALLEYALAIITTLHASLARDYMVSQLAYQYACAWQIDNANDAILLIDDANVVTQTQARIARKIAEYDLNEALSIVGAMTTGADDVLADIAIIQAGLGNTTEAFQLRDMINDMQTQIRTKYRIIDEIAKGITA